MGDAIVTVAEQSLHLLPERAVLWEEANTLIVADTHWGKAATFRAAGLPVPSGTTAEGLERLSSALKRSGANRLVFLGDLLHAREGRQPGTLHAVAEWRERWQTVEMVLVRGNHDRQAGDPPEPLRIGCVNGPIFEGPFAFGHHPRPIEGHYLLAGHLHPAVRLVGRGRQYARLACFWLGTRILVLPAFGAFTGTADVRPSPGDRIFVVADRTVIEVPT